MLWCEVSAMKFSILAMPGKMRNCWILSQSPNICQNAEKLCKIHRKGANTKFENFHNNSIAIQVTGSLNLGDALSSKKVEYEMSNLGHWPLTNCHPHQHIYAFSLKFYHIVLPCLPMLCTNFWVIWMRYTYFTHLFQCHLTLYSSCSV